MDIKILGKGCKKCDLLENHTQKAIEALNLEASIEKVKDQEAIDGFNVLQTPALVINGEVVVQGRVPSTKKIMKLLQ